MAKEKNNEVIKDAKYYERRRQDGIRKVTEKKTPQQRKKTLDRMMAKTKLKKPQVDPVNGVMWGTEK